MPEAMALRNPHPSSVFYRKCWMPYSQLVFHVAAFRWSQQEVSWTEEACAAALMLGASGACMGTRFLASPEAEISLGYKKAVADANDGGSNTVRTTLYDRLRGTSGWPEGYNARGVINKSLRDSESGMDFEENQKAVRRGINIRR